MKLWKLKEKARIVVVLRNELEQSLWHGKKKIPLILNILKKVTSLYLICAQLIKLTFIAWIQGTVLNTVNQKSLRNSSYLQGNEQVNNHKIWQAELEI